MQTSIDTLHFDFDSNELTAEISDLGPGAMASIEMNRSLSVVGKTRTVAYSFSHREYVGVGSDRELAALVLTAPGAPTLRLYND